MRGLATLLLLVIVGGIGYYFGYRAASGHAPAFAVPGLSSGEVGTGGSARSPEARQDRGGVGKTLSSVENQASEFLSDAAITTKIKSKVGLDDTMAKSSVHVSTSNGAVTLTGTVVSSRQRQRAMELARETSGVKNVIDRLQIER